MQLGGEPTSTLFFSTCEAMGSLSSTQLLHVCYSGIRVTLTPKCTLLHTMCMKNISSVRWCIPACSREDLHTYNRQHTTLSRRCVRGNKAYGVGYSKRMTARMHSE